MNSQRTATVNAILSVLKESGINYELNGETTVSEVLTADHKAKVREILFTAFREGQVEHKESFKAKIANDAELKKYVSGLVNNWVRKAKEFNSGQAYKPKNPGSRAGSQDEQIKEMRKLMSITVDDQAKAAIQSAIDTRLAEIQASKQPEVNMEAIPDDLKKLLKL